MNRKMFLSFDGGAYELWLKDPVWDETEDCFCVQHEDGQKDFAAKAFFFKHEWFGPVLAAHTFQTIEVRITAISGEINV